MEIQDFEISMLQISLQDNFYSLPNFYTFLKSRHFKNFLRESFRFDIYIYILVFAYTIFQIESDWANIFIVQNDLEIGRLALELKVGKYGKK